MIQHEAILHSQALLTRSVLASQPKKDIFKAKGLRNSAKNQTMTYSPKG